MLCRCDHEEELHAWGRDHKKQRVRLSCTGQKGFRFCKCEVFRSKESQIETQGEEVMSKKKIVARSSNLSYFVDKAKAKAFDGGSLFNEKRKNYTAVIARTLADAGNDGLTFEALTAKVGKIVEHKSEAVLRQSIRWYLSSKRSDVAKFVSSERDEKTAKSNEKLKTARKPRKSAPKANGSVTKERATIAGEEVLAAPF